jgi:PEP-CTERM motif
MISMPCEREGQFTVQVGLEFSPGVGNLEAGVPEPSTSAMLLGGFGGLGYLALRRRLTVTAAAETSRPRQLIPNL